ncbi:M28 family peptidase [Treponema zioleckii]|uniref:M28 family peptidase n=1 Tax=Treponema zioleckii TaxID=331680 RepID=UPI001F5B3E24|nr:M28 family peptidase [Treponema zioleckii]
MAIPEKMQADFLEYISPDCDRLAFLQNYLLKNGVKSTVLQIEGKNHLYVNFPSTSYDPTFKIKTVVTHYDRVKGTPAANDNSAANLMIADFAVELSKNTFRNHNIRIIFTDGEELGEGGVTEQGAFSLAERLKKNGLVTDNVFVFDSCGRGTVAVLSTAGTESKIKGKFKNDFFDLYERAQELLNSSSATGFSSWMTLPTPYSDNAGFLACGVPAVLITFLPKEEATLYFKNLMADKTLEKFVKNCDSALSVEDEIFKFKYKEKMPVTWRMFHTEMDNHLSLTEESFDFMRKILLSLAFRKDLA